MSKCNIYYLLAALTLTVSAADLAKHTHIAEPERNASRESGSAAMENGRYGLGRPATSADFEKHEYLVGPKGQGLPKGVGTAIKGRAVYTQSCAACHGLRGEGTNEYPPLVGGKNTLKSDNPLPTLGSYWPYATTVWDYVNRAMPYQNPGSLKPDEVYAVTAYLLAINSIISEHFELNERTLPKVRMPNAGGFVPDSRPDVK
jgi:S-disulfanyl-L-cysteine oxidoreductase SoxD